jgi:hypothetical protein
MRTTILLALVTVSGCGTTPSSVAPDAGGIDAGAIDSGPVDGGAADVDAGPVRLRGAIQKGPFILGSSVAISEIDGAGNPNGLVFNTTTSNSLGEFAVDFSYLGAVSLEATGLYYNEASGVVSTAQLTLRAFHEITSGGSQGAYVNLITHLTYGRVQQLVREGSTIAAATAQAEGELRAELHVGPAGYAPEVPGIFLNELGGDTDSSAYLLAVSAVLARVALESGSVDAALSELLNTISADLATDGVLGGALKTRIDAGHRLVNGDVVMSDFRNRLTALGSDAVVPNIHRMLDTDGDGIVNASDNCPSIPNPGQENLDGDLFGDVCDDRTLETTAAWSPSDASARFSVWGDVDGDGDLDLAATSDDYTTTYLYRNDGGRLTDTAVWSSVEGAAEGAVWGDADGDGDLDLLVIGDTARLYRNDGGVLSAVAVWTSDRGRLTDAAWGDVDGDLDLDLVVTENEVGCALYRNDAGTLTASSVWTGVTGLVETSVAWGDVDGDGDLDLAVGGVQNHLFRNDGGTLTSSPVWTSAESAWPLGWDVEWVDVDRDGDLDLTTSSHIYRNDGGTLTRVWTSPDMPDVARPIAWGDLDGDGDLDLAVGGQWGAGPPTNSPSVYRYDSGIHSASIAWRAIGGRATSVAWGDVDGDGDLDLAAGSDIYFNTFR